MRPFVLSLAMMLGLVVAVNLVATWDQERRDRRLEAGAARLAPGLVVAFDGQVDERRFQQARLEVIGRPRIVAFGSSRVRDVASEIAGAVPGEFYNAGMSAAGVDDYIALWSLLERRGNVPEVAVFSVDAWVLSAGNDAPRWIALAPEVARFLDVAGARAGMPLLAQQLLYRWYQAKEFLSFAVLQSSVRDLARGVAGHRQRGDDLLHTMSAGLVREADVGARQAIRVDGSVIRPKEMRDRSTDLVREEVVRHVSGGPYGLADFRWEPARGERLAALWRDMRAAGVDLVVYMPPYHPAAWALLEANPRHAASLRQAKDFLARLSREVGASFVDASDPASIPCAEADFYDMQHATPDCLRRLWQRLLPRR